MTTSRIPAVIDALVSTLTAALTGVKVYDGQWVTAPNTTASFITVGWTPDGEGPTGQQTWAGIGNRARNEQIDIPCYADAYSGSTDTKTRRDAALTLMASAENAVRTDPTLGGVLISPGLAEIGTYSLREEQTESGLEVGVVFHITARARI